MRFIPVKTPFFIGWFFPKYIWKKPTDKNSIYLTFDDGPTPEITPGILDELKKYNAKATFFCIGANIEKHPDLFKRIQQEGHVIGNHTQTHVNGWKSSLETYQKETQIAQKNIEAHLINSSNSAKKLFRPPYGRITSAQGKWLIEKGFSIVMWSILTFDWEQQLSKEKCLKKSLKAKSGDIVVFHDSVKASKNLTYVLPLFLKYYTEKGYTIEGL